MTSTADLAGLFRENYGRIAAALLRRLGPEQLDLVESAIQDAFLKAAELWPIKGAPDSPVGWLIRVAYHAAIDEIGGARRHDELPEELAAEPEAPPALPGELTDDDLRMLFLCCHPSLPIEGQVALLLKTACGFGTGEIARAFLAKEETIAQRLVRAKQTIRKSRLGFELPPTRELAARLDAVALSIYLLFNEGYGASEGPELVRRELCEEAVSLARRLVQHPLGRRPALHALLALMLFHFARIETRTDPAGELLLLKDQDRARWDRSLILEGTRQLALSMGDHPVTKFHLEAGIASCHALAPSWEETDWHRILSYYRLLEKAAPSPVVTLNRVAAMLMSEGPEPALKELKRVERDFKGLRYAMLPAVAAEIYARRGDISAARTRYEDALKLAGTPAERNFLQRKLAALSGA